MSTIIKIAIAARGATHPHQIHRAPWCSTTIDETFQFIGTAAFTNEAGQLRFELIHDPLGDFTVVQGDVNGDGIVDLEAVLVGYVAPLVTSDFYF